MDIKQSEANDFVIVGINGEIDINSSPQLRKSFAEIVDSGKTKIIIDFEEVAYIDSSGLATLIEMMQRLKRNQGVMHLIRMSDKIKGLFEITKLDKLFKIYSTQEEALASS